MHGLCKYLNLHSWNVSNMFCLFLTSSKLRMEMCVWSFCLLEAGGGWGGCPALSRQPVTCVQCPITQTSSQHRHWGSGDRRTHRHPSCWAIQLRFCFFNINEMDINLFTLQKIYIMGKLPLNRDKTHYAVMSLEIEEWIHADLR